MTLFDVHDPRPVHFVGIAGAGMSALAELLARRGITVTGCDANPNRNEALEALLDAPGKLASMAESASARARPDAAERIASWILTTGQLKSLGA